ncbi:MAG: T9SS type A sorting domain-containing protein [Bacteroidales bacterium]|nr:T9SS type A sorting domain-containing protein [Bacteroidales bacterium]
MKKITLLSLLLCMAVSLFAQKSVVFDFAASGEGLPTDAAAEATYTYNGYEFIMQNCAYKQGYQGSANYLMVYQKGKGAKIDGYVTLPALDFKIGSISILTGSSASTNVEVSLINGSETIEAKKLNAQSAEFIWTVTGDEVGTRYTLKVTNSYNAQFQKIVITEASSTGTLSFRESGDVKFGTALDGIQTLSLDILADGLSEDITVTIDGKAFSSNVTTLPATGGAVEVTYLGNNPGTNEGTITLTSGSVTATANLIGVTTENEGTLENPLSLEDVAILCDLSGNTEYWVVGVVAGSAENGGKLAAETTYSNLALGTSEPYVPVQLPSGDIRKAINPYDNPDIVGKKIAVKGQLTKYFSVPGIKNTSDYNTEMYSAVMELQTSSLKAYAINGYIKTTGNNETVRIYNVTGKLVATGVSGRDIKVSDKGIYIVKVGNKTSKVVVR